MLATALEPHPPAAGPEPRDDIDALCIDTIRTLSMDAVQKADSGHPGTPMALAPVIHTLWQDVLRYDPADSHWPNRDRFVLSNGHASIMLYSILFLCGVHSPQQDALTLDDIMAFRSLGSRCPGHPEHGLTPGVETTTGPLGQGCGNSVGMAIAGRWLGARFNRPGFVMFDHDVFAFCGDGDLMEGVSSEAAALAGHLMLGNLCWIYDRNRVTIEGHTDLAFTEDVSARFLAYGWNVEQVGDANDTARLAAAFAGFRARSDVPTLIIVDSHIGYGAPHKQDTSAAHGDPLGPEEIRLAKRRYGWPEEVAFRVPGGVEAHYSAGIGARGGTLHAAWRDLREAYGVAHPKDAAVLDQILAGRPPARVTDNLPVFPADGKGLATREASATILDAVAQRYPALLGGAADLAPSTKTRLNFVGAGDLEAPNPGGRNLHFGIREHAMGAIVNGLALSGLRSYGATYLVFSDYMKPAIRLAALMALPVIHVLTHDSIGVGQDGPTHQPVEQLAALRSMPGLLTFRPADANEVVACWQVIVQLRQPACLVLTRQAVPTLDRSRYSAAAGVARGAYVLAGDADATPALILISTGSEVALCIAAFETLSAEGIAVRVVSMPCWALFEAQDRYYRDAVLPPGVTARVAVEAASPLGWDRYAGPAGTVIAMRSFGASAPIGDLMEKFGFTAADVLSAARAQLATG
ncbi:MULTISPECIES: transketolase [Sphingosinicellaceae]|uniref:transketolase n=1 Tax=Sphingosinicellaceae TaxID=2820280 RepID=UPI001C77ED48|nr:MULTISPECIES: transketolase [Polymorphobacter]QYE33607.1 transketolase [Polymorphobacter sp. PAMC 29334]UAJ12869.1 transketolase [Polymorphobacter megasporae]